MPHSDIHGSTPARGSPWLFAACHVLHRLLVPRHPPNALLSLETHPPELIRRLPPCTETILSGQQPYRSPAKRQSPRKRITLAQHTTVASEHHCHRRDAETSGQTLRWQRPETHQNLIHPDKERHPQFGTPPASQFHPELSGAEQSMPIAFASPRYHPIISRTTEGGGGDRTRTDDPLLAKQVLSQLSYTPK